MLGKLGEHESELEKHSGAPRAIRSLLSYSANFLRMRAPVIT